MRDLYNREQKLKTWIAKAKRDLHGQDKKDVLLLVDMMQEKERSSLWIIRCITALLILRKALRKPFKIATKRDIKKLLKWMEVKKYKAATNEKFRQILKLFYKLVYGKGELYPDCVKWFSSKIAKEKAGTNVETDLSEYLTEDEVLALIDAATTVQRKAFLSGMYEAGARPEEYLRLTNKDIAFDEHGVVVMLRGKTGQRRGRIITFAKQFQGWLAIHPLQHADEFPLWISEATNYKNRPIGIRGAEKFIEDAVPKAGLNNKHARLYILRHSRATYLAPYLTEAQMCLVFGWVIGSTVVRRYVHMSGVRVDSTLITLSQGEVAKPAEPKLRTVICNRCTESMAPTMKYCPKCALPASLVERYLPDVALEQKAIDTARQMEALENRMTTVQSNLQTIVSALERVSQPARNELAKECYKKGGYTIEPFAV